MTRVYLPGVSLLVFESQPLKRKALSPAWPARVRDPRIRVHLGLLLLRLFRATHLLFRTRPLPGWVKSRRTVAARSSVNLNVVPTGARRRLIRASPGLPATRNFRCVWLAPKTCASGGMSGLTGWPSPMGGGVV